MLLINIAWNQLFARVDENMRAIADRGWGAYNRKSLTFSPIRTTMIDSDYLKGMRYHVDSLLIIQKI